MQISSFDKNLLTLTLSILFIAMLVFGIVFSTEDSNSKNSQIILDVILSKTINTETNEKADFLSQNNQIGGGESKQNIKPSSNIQGVAATNEGLSLKEQEKTAPSHSQSSSQKLISTSKSNTIVTNSDNKQKTINKNQIKSKAQEQQRLAKIENSISERIEAYSKRPKSKYISASTKSYEFANYMNYWVKKIERISNLNYPEEAKIRDFIGSLIMTVGINSNGKIESVKIVKSSGFKSIDDAAVHIVEISGPYEPLPSNKNNLDILYITRTWQFLPGNKLKNL